MGSVREGLMYERFVCYRKEYKIHNFVGDYCQISVFFLILPMLIAVGFFLLPEVCMSLAGARLLSGFLIAQEDVKF